LLITGVREFFLDYYPACIVSVSIDFRILSSIKERVWQRRRDVL